MTATNDEAGAAVIYDNINIHTGDSPEKEYPVATYNIDALAEVEIKTKAEIGVNRILNADFETAMSVKNTSRSNIMEQVEDENGNHVLLIERLNSSDFHMDANGVGGTSDYVIYDFDLKLIDPSTSFSVQLKDINANFNTFASVSGGVIKMSTFSGAIADGKWQLSSL